MFIDYVFCASKYIMFECWEFCAHNTGHIHSSEAGVDGWTWQLTIDCQL